MSPARPPRRPSPRTVFLGLAVALTFVLTVLVLALLGYLRIPGLSGRAHELAGLRSILEIRGPGVGPRPLFKRPMGVAVSPRRRIYVTDTGNDRVCVFSLDGKFLFEFGGSGVAKILPGGIKTWRPGRLNYPVGIDCDEEGNVYVADFRNDQIQVFDADGRYLRVFPDRDSIVGRGGSGQDGTGIAVTDVAVRDGKVYATDTYQVLEFSTDGNLIRQFGRPGRGPGDLDHPNGVAVGRDGTVYVSDSNHARIVAFSEEGEVLWELGRIPRDLSDGAIGDFSLPRGLTVLNDGSLVVADAFDFSLVMASQHGRLLQRFGQRGETAGELNFPNDVDRSGRYFVVADKENDRVQVVELLRSAVESQQPK
ncbi:MAG: hypothetical protein WC971_09105 [Coriobacteriia bacterium]